MQIISSVDLTDTERLAIIDEANAIVAEKNQGLPPSRHHQVTKIIVSTIGDELEVQVFTSPHIKRVRRITGYMSEIDRWNDAKIAELKDRKPHT